MNTTYSELLEAPQWNQKRKQILYRDGHRCKHCGNTHSLQVHHKQYHMLKYTGEFVSPWQYQNHLLITLCDTCHKNGHLMFKVPVFKI
jgi:5-methylcytosine-specific restriction endonuclease McrA